MVLISPVVMPEGSGAMPKKVLVLHGENDAVDPRQLARRSLQKFWGVPSSDSWWRIVKGEGHTFRRVEIWTALWGEILGFLSSDNSAPSQSDPAR
jgi:hypothetical protein